MNKHTFFIFFVYICAVFFTVLSAQSTDVNNLSTPKSTEQLENEYPLIKIDPTNMVFLRGQVTSQSASKLINELISLKSKEIYLYIDSPGGSVLAGLDIVQTIQSLQQSGIKIYTIANNAASMAYIIHQHGTERYVKPWSILMQHQMSLGMGGQYYNVKAYGDLIDKLHTKLLEKQAKISKVSVEKFNELTQHDMWLLGNESVEKGFADKVVNVVCDFNPQTTTEILSTWFGDVTLVYSTCPLSNKPIQIKFSAQATSEQIKEITQEYENYFEFHLNSHQNTH